MSKSSIRRFSGMTLLVLLSMALSVPALAQGGRGQGGEGGGRDGGRQRFQDMSEEEREAMMEQMRERMAERQAQMDEQLREDLDASEEEFEILLPLIERVRTLTRERQMATAAATFGGFGQGQARGGRGGRGGEAAGGRGARGGFGGLFETSEEGEALTEAQTELREVIEEKAVAADVKDALDAYREARDAMDEAIDDAREELRGLLTARQEAYMVLNGMLD